MTHDAVVVGSGPNGLVAANLLLDAGWSVLVLEAQPRTGGAVASDDDLQDGFVHDTFSAFYPLTAASPTIQGLHLEEHGLRWRHAPAVLGHPLHDGRWAVLHRDRDVTAGLLEDDRAGDGEAWRELCAIWDRVSDDLVGALLSPFPPVKHGLRLLPRLRGAGGLHMVQTLLQPAAALGTARFSGDLPRLLLAGNAGHADIPLDSSGSGLLGLMLTMLGQTVGYPSPEGGAGRLADALVSRLRSRGGEVRTSAEVTRILVDRGRATGVVLADGERIAVRRGVLADVAAPHLFGRLVDQADLPRRVVRGMRSFRMDPGTVKVDWALDGPVPWASPPPFAPGTVHVSDSVEQMAEALGLVSAGTVPEKPFLLTGQMSTTDPTRSPPGTEALWAYTHVPQHFVRDQAGQLRGDWGPDDRERMADRMQARLEALAPGLGSRVLARRVLGPRELEGRNANLIGGAVGGGSSQPDQQLVFRPVPGLGRAETGIAGLYLASASAHPGGGVHGACGSNAARAALFHHRVPSLPRRHR